MFVVATAGHVDHGKSTLVRALTGMEPDRWAEERRRGMTIDLGYAWMPLGDELLAFVDVPGHQRFIGNMLAGLGPAPAVLFVVAADEGWRRQSAEHLAAIDALGLRHGLLAVTRSDLADPGPAIDAARARIAATSLGDVEAVAVSGRTGTGLDALRLALRRLAASLPAPDVSARVRLWVDRSFTVRGTGTVVTGTLGAGSLAIDDELDLAGRRVRIRSLQSAGVVHERVPAVARVAVNLRGVARESVRRGDALLTPGAWYRAAKLDVRLDRPEVGAQLVLHVGTAAVAAQVRPLGPGVARITLPESLPLQAGDRAILRDPGAHAVAAGLTVLDIDPPALRRRGAAAARARQLADGGVDAAMELARRGAVRHTDLTARGFDVHQLPADTHRVGDWLVAAQQWGSWAHELVRAVDERRSALEPGLPVGAARRAVNLPADELVAPLADSAGLELAGGRVRRLGVGPSLGVAEQALRQLEERLRAAPFAAPEQPELAALGLGPRQVAAAVRTGRVLRLGDGILLLPDAPELARRAVSAVPQPFTASQARQALGTTRRVVIPLLEHLDGLGLTERVDGDRRRVRP